MSQKWNFGQILGEASRCVHHKPYVYFPFSPADNYMTVCTPFFALSATEAYAQPPSSLLQPPPLPPHP